VLTFADHERVDWPAALAGLVDRGRFRTLEIARSTANPSPTPPTPNASKPPASPPATAVMVRRNDRR
jgi:hypothetical protein